MINYNFLEIYMIRVHLFLGLLLTNSIVLCSLKVEVDSRGFHRDGGEVDSRYVNSLEGTPNTSSVNTPRKNFTQVYTNRPESSLICVLRSNNSDNSEYLTLYEEKYKRGLERGVDRKFPNLVLFPFRAEHGDSIGHLLATPDISDADKRNVYQFFTKQLGVPATTEQEEVYRALHGVL